MSQLLSSKENSGLAVLINLTPHDIIVIDGEKIIEIPKSGEVARVTTKSEKIGTAAGLPIFTTSFGVVENLPAPAPGTLLIVSALVRQAISDRADLLSPSQLIRNSDGLVIGCAGFDVN